MSSPIGHSLAGCIISLYKESLPGSLQFQSKSILFYLIVANAPDLDFIPGLLAGKPNLYHHGLSHSIGFGVVVSIAATWLITRNTLKKPLREFTSFFICFLSHLLLDLFSMDGRPPLGIPIFWPFSNIYYMIPILPPVKHSHSYATIGQFLTDLFSLHNLYVAGLEILLSFPFLLILIWQKNRKSQS